MPRVKYTVARTPENTSAMSKNCDWDCLPAKSYIRVTTPLALYRACCCVAISCSSSVSGLFPPYTMGLPEKRVGEAVHLRHFCHYALVLEIRDVQPAFPCHVIRRFCSRLCSSSAFGHPLSKPDYQPRRVAFQQIPKTPRLPLVITLDLPLNPLEVQVSINRIASLRNGGIIGAS